MKYSKTIKLKIRLGWNNSFSLGYNAKGRFGEVK